MQAFIPSQTAQSATNTGTTGTAQLQTSTANQLSLPTWPEKLGMSETDMKLTLTMCGLEDREEDLLPDWFAKTAKKNTSQAAKDRICIEALSLNLLYLGAPIPLTKTK